MGPGECGYGGTKCSRFPCSEHPCPSPFSSPAQGKANTTNPASTDTSAARLLRLNLDNNNVERKSQLSPSARGRNRHSRAWPCLCFWVIRAASPFRSKAFIRMFAAANSTVTRTGHLGMSCCAQALWRPEFLGCFWCSSSCSRDA